MKLTINSIVELTKYDSEIEISLDDHTIVTIINEEKDIDVEAFNFRDPFFDVIFSFNGLGKMFNQYYWLFREKKGKPFPWNYGEISNDLINIACSKTNTTL